MGLRQKTWKREVCEFAIVRLRWLIHMNESTREYDPYYIARYTARNGDIYEGEYKVSGLFHSKFEQLTLNLAGGKAARRRCLYIQQRRQGIRINRGSHARFH